MVDEEVNRLAEETDAVRYDRTRYSEKLAALETGLQDLRRLDKHGLILQGNVAHLHASHSLRIQKTSPFDWLSYVTLEATDPEEEEEEHPSTLASAGSYVTEDRSQVTAESMVEAFEVPPPRCHEPEPATEEVELAEAEPAKAEPEESELEEAEPEPELRSERNLENDFWGIRSASNKKKKKNKQADEWLATLA